MTINLNSLPFPDVIEEINFDELLNAIKILFKEHLKPEEVELLESDNYSALLETLAYREMILRARINSCIKAMLLPYAKGSDLDNVISIYGIQRLKGEFPKAKYEFGLSIQKEVDINIPAGLILRDEDNNTAILQKSIIIRKNELKATGEVILQDYVKTSKVKTEYLQTPLPFVLKAKALEDFKDGSEPESDENFRNRAVLSLDRFSTAGAVKAYKFYAFSANSKVSDVSVTNGSAGVVDIYIKSSDGSDISNEVLEYVNTDSKRPLTDKLNVFMAKKVEVNIKADIELIDMLSIALVDESIKKYKTTLNLGEDLNISYIYKILHQSLVYRANIINIIIDGIKKNIEDIKVDDHSFIGFNLILNYKEAIL